MIIKIKFYLKKASISFSGVVRLLALSMLMSMSLASCGNTDSPSESTTLNADVSSNAQSGDISGTIKLGMIGPLSGDASIYGNAVKKRYRAGYR